MNLRLVSLLALCVIAFTAIGTLSHELGHAAVAWSYGWPATVHYGYTGYGVLHEDTVLREIAAPHYPEIRTGKPFPDAAQYYQMERAHLARLVHFTWGGPAQTMITGTIGLALLLSRRQRFRTAGKLSPSQWLIIFLSLFWLRQAGNFLASLPHRISSGSFSLRSDESRLAYHYGLPTWAISLLTSILAGIVCLIVFRAIPKPQRASFLLAFVIGAPLGCLIWFLWLGPRLLP